jgi:hypothetical protein
MDPVQSDRVRFPNLTNDLSELRLQIGNDTELTGVSVAALATAFSIDRFSTAVDMGRCSALLAAQETVLLTHCHSDHVAGLIAWFSAHTRRHRGRPTRVVVPEKKRAELLAALEIWPDFDGVRRRVNLEEAMVGAKPGATIDLAHGGTATAFSVRHNTSSLGWAVTAEGSRRPAVVFCGDSTVEPFRDTPNLLDASIAVVDCSFIEPGTRVAARLGGHGHLADWLELLPEIRCDHLVLAHLPPGTTAGAILDRLPEDLPGTATVVPWVAPPKI